MEIAQMNPATLIPYENNTKAHTPEQVDRIAESIRRFGWQQPIVVDRNNVVIIGHGRLLAAKQLLLDSVPVVHADNLTEEEAQALRLADNKANESAWDFDKLGEELAALSIVGIDMTAFGFSDVDDFRYLEEVDEDEEQENGEKGKGTAWHTNDVRCDMKPNVASREKSGKRYISLYATSKEGKSLTEIKNSRECETQMVADFVKFVKMTFGSNLQDSGWCLLTTGRRRHLEGYHFATSVCKAASEQLGLRFYEDAIECLNSNRLKPKLEIKKKPTEKNIILFDDIITTGTTMRQTVDLLEHECYNTYVVIGIRNQ